MEINKLDFKISKNHKEGKEDFRQDKKREKNKNRNLEKGDCSYLI